MNSPELPILFFENESAFASWLEKNHDKTPGVWVKLAKKIAVKKTVTYAEAVDVGLCYGWIDSLHRKFDEEYSIQKFTPRKSKSIWSKVNTEKVARLIKENKMRPPGLAEVERAKADGRWANAYEPPTTMVMPPDFLEELKKHPKALETFSSLNKTNTYAIAFRLHNAKKPETRAKRMQQFIEMLNKGEKLH